MARQPNRRTFVRTSVALGSFALIGCKTTSGSSGSRVAAAGDPGSGALRVRNNLNSAAGQKDLDTYRTVVGLMKQGKLWQTWANIHNNNCPHNNWFFLPWHRFYVHYFEQVCRGVLRKNNLSDDFSLPYWNWSDNGAVIPDAFWGDDNALADANRDIQQGSSLSADSVGPDAIENILSITDFLTFGSGRVATQRASGTVGQLEGTPHNDVHSEIGGDMGTFVSPSDPIFWVHHCNVDRLWAEWESRNPDSLLPSNPSPKDARGRSGQTNLTTTFWQNFTLTGYQDINGKALTAHPKDAIFTNQMPVPYTYDTLGGSSLALDGSVATPVQTTDTTFIEANNAQPIVNVDQSNQILTASAPYSAEILPYVQKVLAGNANKGSLVLTINNIPVPTDDADHNVVLHFFANFPQVTPQSAHTDPHFLTSLAFFAHNHPGAATALNFTIDLTSALPKLAQAGIDVSQALNLQVLVVDRKLKSLPSPAFFQGITLTLTYKEAKVS